MKANEANWDARAPVHLASQFYGVGSKEAEYWFAAHEWDDLGDVAGRDVVHLQCHLGVETVAFARRGARTVGLDFSAESLRNARRIAEGMALDVDYVHSNVYDAVAALGGRTFDVVYTGKGALCYLPDLTAWAQVVADLLRPGGFVYVVEFHPLLNALGTTPHEKQELLLRYDYQEGRGVWERDATFTYTDGPRLTGATVSYEWRHGLGAVHNALVGAGLRVELLRETEEIPWPRWQDMVTTPSGWWRLPAARPRVPLLFTMRARKSAHSER
ncbi:methyltransferase type 12 [Kibdelosporangium phytohabitans]|uniref:Methyltransferase type 12 n=2 Tax=Kibdelosporangium phytohabitans TaxID=860235 RepID=A0A0N9IJA1_9PSEU|nr:class I SAM-dependent methyltransferase [Kibdelosporangium phytohabitans]ALG15581.1 methyltransferase type 12 [Kibdelosporangium phytohabitans]